LSRALTQLKEVTEDRHRLVHGEWWFNVFENNQLEVLALRNGKITCLQAVTSEKLTEWAEKLDEIGDDLDAVEYRLRLKMEG
jgi:hypothetical protein